MNKITILLLAFAASCFLNGTTGTVFKNRNKVIVEQEADSRQLRVEHEDSTYSTVGQFVVRAVLALVDIVKNFVRNLFFGGSETRTVLLRSARSVDDDGAVRLHGDSGGDPDVYIELHAESRAGIDSKQDADQGNGVPYVSGVSVYRPESNPGHRGDSDGRQNDPARRGAAAGAGSTGSSFVSSEFSSSSSFEMSSSSFNQSSSSSFNQTSSSSSNQTSSSSSFGQSDSSSAVGASGSVDSGEESSDENAGSPFQAYGPPRPDN